MQDAAFSSIPARSNLPLASTSLVGRERELADVAHLLREVRLLTLTGAGGVGKTRLALQAAADLLDQFADGVFFVSLAPISDPELVAPTIAQTLGVKEVAGHTVIETLKNDLRGKALLLVLDNFEQVAAAAPLVAELLVAAPRLTALVTSRAVLRLYGEWDFPVPPLALPDHQVAPTAQYLSHYGAVHLLVARAQAARPDFVLTDQNAPAVAELCHRLEGLPLAIELAAAWLRVLTLPTLLGRLERRLPLLTGGPRDLPARQQALRATIGWSYDLLTEAEQVLFRRLAIFRGGTLDAVEVVCGAAGSRLGSSSTVLPPLAIDVLGEVRSLVEKSLLRREELGDGQPWYVMLEMVREYALERLAESGEEDAVRRRYILHYLALAETADLELSPGGRQQAAWLVRIEREHDNLRAALEWCVARGYAEPAFRLAVALWWFWAVHGHVSEGRQRLAGLLARFPLRGPSDKHAGRYAQALRAAGLLAAAEGDHATARALQEESLRLRRCLGDSVGIYQALESLGVTASVQGDHPAAHALLEEALAIARTLDDPEMVAWSLHSLGNVVLAQGDHAAARALLEECRALQGNMTHWTDMRGATLLSLAVVARELAEYDLARRLASEAVDLHGQEGQRRNEADGLATLGSIAAAQGDHPAAEGYLGASLAVHQELGNPAGIAYVLERYAELAATGAQPARAIRLAAAAAALHEQIGIPLSPDAQARLDRMLRPARQTLGERAAEEAWVAGRALSPDKAIAEALSPAESAPAVAAMPPGGEPADVLTRREREVAVLIARGYTNRRIAAELFITEGTAANHVVHILNKLGYNARAQIAVWAAEHSLLAPAGE